MGRKKRKKNSEDSKRKWISLGDTWYCICPSQIQKKKNGMYVLYHLSTANQLSGQWLFVSLK